MKLKLKNQTSLILQMMQYEKGCPHRIQHFLKVLTFAQTISELEGLDQRARFILETAALVHDIGIRPSLEKYGNASGHYQEQEGPPAAKAMLDALGYPKDIIARVCYLVGHHHSYDEIDGLDYQILVEADFLVNIQENELGFAGKQKIRDTIFKTTGGLKIFDLLYPQ